MVILERLSRGAIWRLVEAIEREPEPSPWTAEVERILLDGVGASHLYEAGSALLLANADGVIVGAALHYNHEELPGVQYIAALLIDHRHRGRGYGRETLQAVIDDARNRSTRTHAAWAVHPDNEAMLHLSHELGEHLGVDQPTGYHQFVHP